MGLGLGRRVRPVRKVTAPSSVGRPAWCRLLAAAAATLLVTVGHLSTPGSAGPQPEGAGRPWFEPPKAAHAQTVPRIGTAFGEVGSLGGTVRGSGFSVAVPPGAVPAGAPFSVTLVPQQPDALPPPPPGTLLVGRPILLLIQNAAGQPAALDAPLEVRMTFAPPRPGLPHLHVLVDRQWLPLPSEVDGGEVVAAAAAGATVALFLRPIPPELPRTGRTVGFPLSGAAPTLRTGLALLLACAATTALAATGMALRARRRARQP